MPVQLRHDSGGGVDAPQEPLAQRALHLEGHYVPIASEAKKTLEYYGVNSLMISDVGVAGLWRLTERLQDIQNILIGNPIDNLKKVKIKRIENPEYYVFINASSEKYRTTYFFDTENFRIREQRFLLLDKKNSILSIKYPLYQKTNGKIIPKQIQISSFINGEFVSISLELISVDYPSELTIPFKFPEGYSKIKL